MSELNHQFFKELAGKLSGFKRQVGQAIQKKKAEGNGAAIDPPCECCGKPVKVTIRVALGAVSPRPIYCAECDTLLHDGCGALVTVEAPKHRYWIGKGLHPNLVGKVTVITTEQMDMIEKRQKEADEKLKTI